MCKYKKNILSFAVGYRVVCQTHILCLTYKYVYIRHIDTPHILIMSDIIKKPSLLIKRVLIKSKRLLFHRISFTIKAY